MFSDFRHAYRTLARTPGFTAVALATLALGIGANTAIFSVVHGVLLRPLPYRDPERLVVVWEDLIREENHRFSVAEPNFADLGARVTSLAGVAAQVGRGFDMTGGAAPEAVLGDQVTGNFFTVLGVRPALGRAIGPEDERQKRRVVVISNGLWKRRFGGAPDVVGAKVVLGGEPFVVAGVMAPEFEMPAQLKAPQSPAEIWTPLDLPESWKARGVATLQVIGRLKSDVSLATADAEVRGIGRQLAREYPDTNSDVGLHAVPLRTQIFGDVRPALLVLSGAVGFLLLVACANVAHLLLARAVGRRRETAIRVALGASRGQIVRTFFAESFLLAVGGGLAGVAIVWLSTSSMLRAAPREIPRLSQARPDLAVLGFAIAASLVAALAAGVLPALRAASEDPELALRGEAVASGLRSGRLRSMLVVSQIALSLVLFSGAALLLRTFERLRHFDLGFEAASVVTARMGLPRIRYTTAAQQLAFFDRLFARLEAAPGVVAAGGTTRFPLDPAYGVGSIRFEGGNRPPGSEPVVGVRVTGGSYFRAMRIPLASGRDFDERDRPGALPVVLVNRAMAERFWPGQSPLGKRIAIDTPRDAWLTIVGVVGDVSHDGIDAAALPEAYLPLRQSPGSGLNLVLRGEGDARSYVDLLRKQVAGLDPDLALAELRPMSDRVADALSQPRFLLQAVGGFALLALLLASVALFALVSQEAAHRRREVGIRMALGARRADVLLLFMARTSRVIATGVLAGIAGTLFLTRLIRPALHGTPANDPESLGSAALILCVIALVASVAGARRATRLDPLEALRSD